MEAYRKCPHCKGTGICMVCHGTGRLALQKGKHCTSCFPHGSGKCQNGPIGSGAAQGNIAFHDDAVVRNVVGSSV